MADRNEQIDSDIRKCKVDILRARETIPPVGKKNEEEQEQSSKSLTPTPVESAGANQQKSEIPAFDLAEEIMAKQRKITAIKRKAPGQKTSAQSQEKEIETIGYAIEHLKPSSSEQQQIIAEIVARDIEKLCRRGTSGN